MKISKLFFSFLLVLFICSGLASYGFIRAYDESVWFPPTAGTPPAHNVAGPITKGLSTTTVQQGNGSLLFDNFAATTDIRSDSYCDSQGKNCFSPDAVGPDTGNQMVYFATPRTMYGPSTFRTPGQVFVSYDFAAAGYPPNMVRAYIGFDRQHVGGKPLPYGSVGMPLANNAEFIGSGWNPDSGLLGDWFMVKDAVISFGVDCGDVSCGAVAGTNNFASLKLLGFECSGPCQEGQKTGSGVNRSCLVNFTYWINGAAGTIQRRLFGDATDRFAIGLWAVYHNYPGLSLPFTEQVYGQSWDCGSICFHSASRAAVGYFTVDQYAAQKPYLDSLAGNGNYKIGSAFLKDSTTAWTGEIRILNQGTPNLGDYTIAEIAQVVSCTE